ncbi:MULTISPECIES: Gfo/Idh/MocA family protein [Bacillus]|uniref:Gfo/Idh/MocA family protein n=1 Tax=Bacillus TaxID=1386 RepID=UPI0002F47817|nr:MULTISPECIES: Gfo/Idh/MocA family oxidoreductase [Bacillus]
MKKLNWAILGPGMIARDFSQALNNDGQTIYAVASRDLNKAITFANTYNIEKAYGSYEEMLNDDNIDVVYIATPHCNHYEYIIKCLRQNKHVLCEKAITVNSKQLNEIITLANKKNLVVCEAMTIFHMPLYKKLKEIINSGTLGKVKMIQVSFGSCKEYDVKNRFFNMGLAGGALLDIGTYALSFTRYFLSSQPNEILTTVKKFETGVDEQSSILLKNDHGEMAVVSLTMRSKMPKRGIVACEHGFITVDDFPRADKAVITYTNGITELIEAGDTSRALEYEIDDMNNYVQNKQQNSTLPLTMDVMDMMTRIREDWGIIYPFE